MMFLFCYPKVTFPTGTTQWPIRCKAAASIQSKSIPNSLFPSLSSSNSSFMCITVPDFSSFSLSCCCFLLHHLSCWQPTACMWRALGKYFWISCPWDPASFHKEPSHSGRGCVTSRETIICIITIKGRILLLAKLEKLGWTLIPLETGHLPSLSTDFSSIHSAMHFLLCCFSSLSDLCSCWVCIIF